MGSSMGDPRPKVWRSALVLALLKSACDFRQCHPSARASRANGSRHAPSAVGRAGRNGVSAPWGSPSALLSSGTFPLGPGVGRGWGHICPGKRQLTGKASRFQDGRDSGKPRPLWSSKRDKIFQISSLDCQPSCFRWLRW